MPGQGTWLAIVDSEHARLVRHDEMGFHTIWTLDSAYAHKSGSELASDRLGRSFESASPTRHAIAPRQDPRTAARMHFARTVASELNRLAAQAPFQRLVLAAPPRTMPLLRASLDPELRRRTIGSLTKDLIKVPDADLPRHLPSWPIVL